MSEELELEIIDVGKTHDAVKAFEKKIRNLKKAVRDRDDIIDSIQKCQIDRSEQMDELKNLRNEVGELRIENALLRDTNNRLAKLTPSQRKRENDKLHDALRKFKRLTENMKTK